LYDWATAMALPSRCNKSSCASQVGAKHRGICPSGWHIPSDAEWTTLTDYVGADYFTVGIKLRATSGWNYDGNDTDDYGFSALPGGLGNHDGSFGSVGNVSCWWSSSEPNDSKYNAYYVDGSLCMSINGIYRYGTSKPDLISVRCVKD